MTSTRIQPWARAVNGAAAALLSLAALAACSSSNSSPSSPGTPASSATGTGTGTAPATAPSQSASPGAVGTQACANGTLQVKLGPSEGYAQPVQVLFVGAVQSG